MKTIKSLSLLFVIGEYCLSLPFCLTRFLLALYLSSTDQYAIIVILIIVIFNEDANITKWFTEGSSKEY